MRTSRLRVLLIGGAAFAVVLYLAVQLLFTEGPGGLPPPLTVEAARALPDNQLAALVSADISRRLYRRGYDVGAWKSLAEPARSLWLATVIEPKVLDKGILFYLLTHEDGAPGLDELREAYSGIGAPIALDDAMDRVGGIAAGDGGDAVKACAEYCRSNHAPPFVRPPGFSDPFAVSEGKLRAALAAADTAKLRAAYAREHLDALLGK